MVLRLIQLALADGERCVAALDEDGSALRLDGVASVYELAGAAIAERLTLAEAAHRRLTGEMLDVTDSARGVRLLPPIDHPDPAHLYLSGTGLTHLGSAESRDGMHALAIYGRPQTDTMRMFLEGLRDGKPAEGPGSQPEWFYKGDGSSIVPTGAALEMPSFALGGGEEPEIAGIYLIDPAGRPLRLGFCLANEFSDHLTERQNYLWLAHSKLRQAALGPELLDTLPPQVRGTSRILRGSRLLWQKPFLTGEANMSHSISNLEYHHFKYGNFRRPGDVHVHFFGTATLSFSDEVRCERDDVFEISADAFLLPVRNRLAPSAAASFVVRPL